MRKKIIAGNWKMNKSIKESGELVGALKDRLKDFRNEVEVVICPPFTSLAVAQSNVAGSALALGAQNMSQHDDGAYTGEVSASMLVASGCRYVILGHSERRQYFHETDELINAKVKKALSGGLLPIVCIGETLEEREAGVTDKVVATQVKGVLQGIPAADLARLVIAYEPVWAIGTGKTATPEQANEVHQLIRKLVSQLYSWPVADALRILYGGSMNAQNAAALLGMKDIDGGLIGGASLKADAFIQIIQAGVEASTK